MPNDTLAAVAAALPDDSHHPDAALFAAFRSLNVADDEVGRAASWADAVRARREGRAVTADDQAGLDSANRGYESALDGLLALTPQTPAGARAILRAIFLDGSLDREATQAALSRLADAPALADRH